MSKRTRQPGLVSLQCEFGVLEALSGEHGAPPPSSAFLTGQSGLFFLKRCIYYIVCGSSFSKAASPLSEPLLFRNVQSERTVLQVAVETPA